MIRGFSNTTRDCSGIGCITVGSAGTSSAWLVIKNSFDEGYGFRLLGEGQMIGGFVE